jgi:NIMA (never in mitosis gene a)-related kinase
MEYADNGDLFQRICEHKTNTTNFQESEIWRILIQTIRGIKACHDLKIMHRDLKSANIFMYRDFSVKLGDMNVSKVTREGLSYTQTGTPYYASPEVWKDQPYDFKSDIWSCGCVLYEAITLKPPFRAEDMHGLYKKVVRGQYQKIAPSYSKELHYIIKCMLQVQPNLRPSCNEILAMNFISRKAQKLYGEAGEPEYHDNELLQTIKISKNLFALSAMLPSATYNEKNRNKKNFSPKRNTLDITGTAATKR